MRSRVSPRAGVTRGATPPDRRICVPRTLPCRHPVAVRRAPCVPPLRKDPVPGTWVALLYISRTKRFHYWATDSRNPCPLSIASYSLWTPCSFLSLCLTVYGPDRASGSDFRGSEWANGSALLFGTHYSTPNRRLYHGSRPYSTAYWCNVSHFIRHPGFPSTDCYSG